MYKIICLITLCLLITSCSENSEQVSTTDEPVRAVKLFKVIDNKLSQNRVLIGKVIASTTADLSFPLAGKVVSIKVNTGDQVKAEQILATLDTTDLIQSQKAAAANLTQAKVQYQNQRADYERKKALVDKGLITLSDLDAAQTNMSSAKAQMDIAQTDLRDANNRLKDTTLKAPFSGVISAKSIEPHTEVSAGQAILAIEADDQKHQVEFSVPEVVMHAVKLGTNVNVKLGKSDAGTVGVITEIAPTASAGNVFKVKATLETVDDSIKSGLAAEVTLSIHNDETPYGVFIPVTAIMGGLDQNVFVYVYHSPTQQLEKRRVEKADQVIGNQLAVTGLTAGEEIVSAGVSFVSEGMKVKPYIAE